MSGEDYNVTAILVTRERRGPRLGMRWVARTHTGGRTWAYVLGETNGTRAQLIRALAPTYPAARFWGSSGKLLGGAA